MYIESRTNIPSTTDTHSGDAYYAKARRAIAEKNYYEALSDCQQALVLGCSPQYMASALNLKGTLVFLKGDAEEALECFKESIHLDPSYVQNYIKCSNIFMEQGDIEGALRSFQQAITINPVDPDIYYHRGQGKYRLNQINRSFTKKRRKSQFITLVEVIKRQRTIMKDVYESSQHLCTPISNWPSHNTN